MEEGGGKGKKKLERGKRRWRKGGGEEGVEEHGGNKGRREGMEDRNRGGFLGPSSCFMSFCCLLPRSFFSTPSLLDIPLSLLGLTPQGQIQRGSRGSGPPFLRKFF
jgi:hypothetical protein